MKLSNIFKKTIKVTTQNNIQRLDKKQLSKVVGGIDDADKDRTVTINTSHVEWSK